VTRILEEGGIFLPPTDSSSQEITKKPEIGKLLEKEKCIKTNVTSSKVYNKAVEVSTKPNVEKNPVAHKRKDD